MEQSVTFTSDGLKLAGQLAMPASGAAKKPAIVIMHGFGGHKDGPQQRWSQTFYNDLGYATLRFDFRGCGASEGKRGWVLPYDQVADARAAVSYLAAHPDIDPARIVGVIAQGGWANGERMFRFIHATPEAWHKFSDLLARGRARTSGDPPIMAHRFDIIPVPQRLHANIAPPSIMEFPAETATETLAFNAGDVAARIAPRPLLLLHSAQDEVIAADGSFDLFKSAGYHGDLHIIGGVDHFMFGEDDRRVADIVRNWLLRNLPA
jgi:alpha-beta hydrolase superfamily lysophospholipase